MKVDKAVKNLLLSDKQQLFEHLGIRSMAIGSEPTKAGSFEPRVTYSATTMGLLDDVRKLGERIFKRLNPPAHKLICGTDSEDQQAREELTNAVGSGSESVAAILSTLLITQLGIAPAIAVVLATLIVKKFFKPAYQQFCQEWEEGLS